VKNIMNTVFKNVRAKVSSGTEYSGANIVEMSKNLIIETTKSNSSGPEEQQKAIKAIMNTVFKSIKGFFQPETSYDGQEVIDFMKQTIIKTTNDLLNQNDNQTSNDNDKTNTRLERSESTRVGKEVETTGGIEVQRRDAESRIKPNPSEKDVDLTDPSIVEYYIKVRNDYDPLNWVIYSYDTEVKNKVKVHSSGEGDFSEIVDHAPDNIPVYIYFKYLFGDTKRARFILVSFVPDSFHGIQKSKVLGHRSAVQEFFKYFAFSWDIKDITDLEESTVVEKLLKSGGANYSVQEQNKGDFGSYKKTTKGYYSEKEKGGNVKIVYSENPLSLTPMDISGRPSVAPTTDFKTNTKF